MAWYNSLKDLVGDVTPLASHLPGVGTAIGLGASALGSLFGGKKLNQADKLQSQRLDQARAGQADRDILRKRAMARLGNIPGRPNLGSLFAGSANPFARGGGMPQAGPPTAGSFVDPRLQPRPKLGPLML